MEGEIKWTNYKKDDNGKIRGWDDEDTKGNEEKWRFCCVACTLMVGRCQGQVGSAQLRTGFGSRR